MLNMMGENLQYKCNMGIGIGMFLFGYGISLSGHTLYKLFQKQEDGSKNDDE